MKYPINNNGWLKSPTRIIGVVQLHRVLIKLHMLLCNQIVLDGALHI